LAIENIDEHKQDGPSAGVADIRELCVQFQRAIAALASNDVAELENSTAAQDGLVEQLQGWFRGQPSGQEPSITISPSDPGIGGQLEDALGDEIRQHEVQMRVTPEGLVVSLREVGFFNSGQAELLQNGHNTIDSHCHHSRWTGFRDQG
jgi:hypothetical protein